MSLQTPMNRVLGFGSAKEGTGHWWSQRLTSVAMIPLTVLFVIPFLGALGLGAEQGVAGYEAVRAIYANPLNALIGILFVVTSFLHLQQGLQVVIEDYVHGKGWRTTLLVLNTLGCFALGAAGALAIMKIAFSA